MESFLCLSILFGATIAVQLPPLATHVSLVTPEGLYVIGGLTSGSNSFQGSTSPGFLIKYNEFSASSAIDLTTSNSADVSGRWEAPCVFGDSNNRIYCLNGAHTNNSRRETGSNGVIASDLYSLDLGPKIWTSFKVPNYNLSLAAHRAVWMNKEIYSFGGYWEQPGCSFCTNPSRTVRVINPVTLEYKELEPSSGSTPNSRGGFCMLGLDDERFIIIGGISQFSSSGTLGPRSRFGDVWVYNIKTNEWNEIFPRTNVTFPTGSASACAKFNSKIYVFGGLHTIGSSFDASNALWELETKDDEYEWKLMADNGTLTNDDNVPSARRSASASVVGKYLVVYGGLTTLGENAIDSRYELQNSLNSSARFFNYDLCTKEWTDPVSSIDTMEKCENEPKSTSAGLIAGIVTGVIILLVLMTILVFYLKSKKGLMFKGKKKKMNTAPVSLLENERSVVTSSTVDVKAEAPLLEKSSSETARIYEAISGYEPQLSDELRISIGDRIIVSRRFDDGWAEGVNMTTKQVGALPLICLEEGQIDETPSRPKNINRNQSLLSKRSITLRGLDGRLKNGSISPEDYLRYRDSLVMQSMLDKFDFGTMQTIPEFHTNPRMHSTDEFSTLHSMNSNSDIAVSTPISHVSDYGKAFYSQNYPYHPPPNPTYPSSPIVYHDVPQHHYTTAVGYTTQNNIAELPKHQE